MRVEESRVENGVALIGNLRSARGVGFNEIMAIRDEMKLVKALTTC